MNKIAVLGLAAAGVVAWLVLGNKAQAKARTGYAKVVVEEIGGQTVITPSMDTPTVLPYIGAAPVQPKAYTLPPLAITSPVGQIKVFNTHTMDIAWTRISDLPNMIAGGWIVMTDEE